MARGQLKISKEISFPRNAVTQTFAYIGRKGAGKTYLASMVAEQMLDNRDQTVVIDPVGVWWGLRVNADGKTKGKQIFVIGGDHGDVPLVPEAGARIAQLIVEKGVSAVLDVSSFRIGERKRFLMDFGEEFFQLKKQKRTPVHLYLEEAQLIVPQNIRPEEVRMYSAFEQIVRLGRNYGIGCSLITQRPQSVNKEVLSQVECLCVLQITGPHERKAIEGWVEEVGADRKLVGELPGLARGEGYVWSPSWLRIYKRVHFTQKQTFDASATPEVGKKTRAASLSAVDVVALKKDIADVVEQAEKDDPVALRKKISMLEIEIKKKPAVASDPSAISKAVAAREQELLKAFEDERARYRFALTNASTTLRKIAELTSRSDVLELTKKDFVSPVILPKRIEIKGPQMQITSVKILPPTPAIDGEFIPTKSQQRILDALAWLEQIGKTSANKNQLALISDQRPTSGGYFNNLGAMRSAMMISYPTPGEVQLTPAGRSLAHPVQISSNDEVHIQIKQKLTNSQTRILEVLIGIYPNDISKDELAERAEQRGTSGGYFNNLGSMRTMGVLDYPTPGRVKATEILFPL